MVAGHLREKSGYYYAVLNYTDSLGKRKTKWISTGLTVKGNKKRAEAILMDARRNFNPEEPKVMNGDILFADYMEKWLDIIKSSVAVPTFASYSTTVKKIVAPYFREKEVTLKNLTAKDIQEFYLSELERVSPSSVIHYHANIHKALKYAVKIDLIDVNPADKVERPKKDRYVGSFYDADEVNALFEAAKGSKLELPILFGAFYGLRRSEAIGLKWDAIDFDQNTITIRHTVTSCDLDGKRVLVASDTTKTKSSMRTLPLVPFMRERLLTLKEEQQEEIERQKQEAEQKKKQEQQRLNEASGKVNNIQGNVDAVGAEIEEVDNELVEVLASIDMIQEELAAKEEAIEETTAEYEAARATEQAQYDAMKVRIKYLYEK